MREEKEIHCLYMLSHSYDPKFEPKNGIPIVFKLFPISLFLWLIIYLIFWR